MTYKEFEAHVKSVLSERLILHSVNVASFCGELALIYGVDTEKARIAGVLHDIRKEASRETLRLEIARFEAEQSEMNPDPVELDEPKLHHSIAGAYYARETLGITDADILNAIRFHTVARAGMSMLEKITYISDAVSAERKYDGVEQYREWARGNLDNAMYEILRWSIVDTLGKGGRIPRYTIEAYNYYNKLKGEAHE